MNLLFFSYSVVLLIALVITVCTVLKYKKLNDKYNRTLEWGKAMQEEAIKQGDLYRNASDKLDIISKGRKK